ERDGKSGDSVDVYLRGSNESLSSLNGVALKRPGTAVIAKVPVLQGKYRKVVVAAQTINPSNMSERKLIGALPKPPQSINDSNETISRSTHHVPPNGSSVTM
ncbi:hypothetical protein MMC14_004638, partial [Varicellaria rhodocarpa]|nr:hypothetical protein [Varicellaria rhodocarpa]